MLSGKKWTRETKCLTPVQHFQHWRKKKSAFFTLVFTDRDTTEMSCHYTHIAATRSFRGVRSVTRFISTISSSIGEESCRCVMKMWTSRLSSFSSSTRPHSSQMQVCLWLESKTPPYYPSVLHRGGNNGSAIEFSGTGYELGDSYKSHSQEHLHRKC